MVENVALITFYPSEEMEPRFGAALVNVMRLRPSGLDSRQAPDGHK
jgi:hypothetical protein